MKKGVMMIILTLFLTLCLFVINANAQHGPGMIDWGYGMHWVGAIFMITFWFALIIGIFFLIRWLLVSTRSEFHGVTPRESAIDILKKRYARGEIDKNEFEEKKKDLLD